MGKQKLERILFHRERRLITFEAQCPDCGALDGQFHEMGCPREECPRCGQAIITCRCTDTFSAVDLGCFSVALEKTMDWREAATGVAKPNATPWTLTELASYNRFVKSVMAKTWASEVFTDGQGGAVFTENLLSRGLSVTLEDAQIFLGADFVDRSSPSNFWQ